MSRDKKGRPTHDDMNVQQEMAGAGMGGDGAYEPFVFYEFEII